MSELTQIGVSRRQFLVRSAATAPGPVASVALERMFGSVVEAFVKRADTTLTPLVAAGRAAPGAPPITPRE